MIIFSKLNILLNFQQRLSQRTLCKGEDAIHATSRSGDIAEKQYDYFSKVKHVAYFQQRLSQRTLCKGEDAIHATSRSGDIAEKQYDYFSKVKHVAYFQQRLSQRTLRKDEHTNTQRPVPETLLKSRGWHAKDRNTD